MMLVAIDTSTDTATVALVKDNQVLAELTWRSGQNHTTQLLPNLAYLLKLTGTDTGALTAVVVAKGPGSFNGLRVGISAAKGLACSLNIPIVGISSLEVAACAYAATCMPVCPVFNAGRNEIATALYRQQGDDWRLLVDAHITTVEQLCTRTVEKTVFCGDYVPQIAPRLKELLGERAVIADPLTDIRRGSYLAALGGKRLAAGEADNVTTLQAVYLRRPPITQSGYPW